MPELGTRSDPFLAFRFQVDLDDLSAAGFTDCTGLDLETEVFEYIEGGLNSHVHKLPTRSKQSTLTLKRGIVDRVLWNWYWDLAQGEVRLRNGSIFVRDPAGGETVMEWQFRDAFPSKILGPELSAQQSMVAVETLELSHQGLERRR